MKIELLRANIPSKSGIIYTLENFEALVMYFRKITATGIMLGDLKSGLEIENGKIEFSILPKDASHVVENIMIENDVLYAEIKFLSGECGRLLYSLYIEELINFYPLIIGKQISSTEIDSSTLELLTVRVMTLPAFSTDDNNLSN